MDRVQASACRAAERTTARGGLVLAGAAGEQDQVLVELEPGAVIRVDARRGDELPVSAAAACGRDSLAS